MILNSRRCIAQEGGILSGSDEDDEDDEDESEGSDFMNLEEMEEEPEALDGLEGPQTSSLKKKSINPDPHVFIEGIRD